MSSSSTFKGILSIITWFILPVAALIWTLFIFPIPVAILITLAQLVFLCLLNLVIEKACDNDGGVNFFSVAILALLFIIACYWPWIVVNYKLAIIFDLAQIAILSILINLVTGGDMDFLEWVFVVSLALLAAYWPWIICPFKPALIIFVIEAGLIFFFGGAFIESDGCKIFGIALLAVLAVAWPWLFVKYNIAIIIILAELFVLGFVYEMFKGFENKAEVIGVMIFLILLAVGWPWLAFLGMEKYLWYAIPSSIGSAVVSGIITKLVVGLSD